MLGIFLNSVPDIFLAVLYKHFLEKVLSFFSKVNRKKTTGNTGVEMGTGLAKPGFRGYVPERGRGRADKSG